jgi:hypothetical protein
MREGQFVTQRGGETVPAVATGFEIHRNDLIRDKSGEFSCRPPHILFRLG